ncbi:MAG: Gfo/Idh/MocA family oxidoreductase [Clostridia bacterium]|nr:Gfo/Idh/MocA family oxidoreductase [Clostridia bacterium]
MINDTIRVGVLGPGRIVSRVMKDFHTGRGYALTAVASRSPERAQAAARAYGARYAFDSYEALAACEEVDLVYIAVPHPFHCPLAIQMMESGKHVICEKPMALNERETRAMTDCAKAHGVFLMEAMWTRFFPAMRKMVSLVQGGAIGRVNHIYSVFSAAAEYDPASRAFDPALGGGALLDIGVYPLMACTQLLGWTPERVQGAWQSAPTGVDMRMAAQLQFPGGATAQIMGGMDACAPSHLLIYGTEGCVTMEDFWHPTAFTLVGIDGRREEYTFRPENEGFHHEFEEAARCIREGLAESPLMTHEESIAVSRITERLRREAGILYPGE